MYSRGVSYYKQGNIISAKINDSVLSARVFGTEEYQIRIECFSNYYCTCPYDFGGYCKHVVAVLLYASEHFAEMMQKDKLYRVKLEKIFSTVSAKQVKEFLQMQIKQDETLQMQFLDYFGEDNDPIMDYKSEIIALYKNASFYQGMIEYGNKISFDGFIRTAKTKEAKKNYAEATRIYQELSEVIAENMEMTDDSDGYYGDCFCGAIYDMTSSIDLLHN